MASRHRGLNPNSGLPNFARPNLVRVTAPILELINEMEAERAKALAAKVDEAMTQKITDLQRIRGIGQTSRRAGPRGCFTAPSPIVVNSPVM